MQETLSAGHPPSIPLHLPIKVVSSKLVSMTDGTMSVITTEEQVIAHRMFCFEGFSMSATGTLQLKILGVVTGCNVMIGAVLSQRRIIQSQLQIFCSLGGVWQLITVM